MMIVSSPTKPNTKIDNGSRLERQHLKQLFDFPLRVEQQASDR